MMLFPRKERPDANVVHAIIDGLDSLSVSHDPAREGQGVKADHHWLEIVMDGLTFDISGLMPGPAVSLPEMRLVLSESIYDIDAEAEAIAIKPGPHLAGGAYLLPILRGLLMAGSRLGKKTAGLQAYYWSPAKTVIDPQIFSAAVGGWAGGGPFPAELLIALRDSIDGGLHSEGLTLFTAQELRLEPDLVDDRNHAHRLAVRLLRQLVLHGRLEVSEEVTGPDGSALRLAPSANGKFVRVWRR